MSTVPELDPRPATAASGRWTTADDRARYGPDFVVALARGLRLLEAFSADRPAMGLSELARRAGLSKRATYRLATTLEALGYLVQDPLRKTYRPSVRVLDLGFTVLEGMELREKARPFLAELASRLQEFVSLAVLDGADIVFIDTVKPPAITVGVQTEVGSRLPAHCNSHGKVMLAYLPADRLDALLRGQTTLVKRTPNTINDPVALRAELIGVRARGFAVNDEESSLGLRSIAAPIRSRSGEVVATVNIAVPTVRATRADLETIFGPPVLATAARISAALGYHPAGPA